MYTQDLPLTAATVTALGRVGVLLGGQSAEREVSLMSGEAIASALESAGIEVVRLDLGDDALTQLQQAKLDRVFIALHGPGGEDGRIQAVLETMGLPYTGSGVAASALAIDKLRTKQLWMGIGLPTPVFEVLREDSDWSAVLDRLGGKAMVKPAHEGSSIGMTMAFSASELQQAYVAASDLDGSVLAERLITGAEYTVAVIDGKALPAIQLQTDNQFYDYEAKYLSDDTRYLCPCGLSVDREAELADLAEQAFASLGCKGWGRVDVMATEAGEFLLLEVNTVPGMTSHSLVPIAASAQGASFEQLVVKIIMDTLDK